MLDYMIALQKRFAKADRHSNLEAKIESTRRSLSEQLDLKPRKQLLRLVDLEDALRNEVALDNFVAGFKLALGIAKELREDGSYSYESEEQEKSIRSFWKEQARGQTE